MWGLVPVGLSSSVMPSLVSLCVASSWLHDRPKAARRSSKSAVLLSLVSLHTLFSRLRDFRMDFRGIGSPFTRSTNTLKHAHTMCWNGRARNKLEKDVTKSEWMMFPVTYKCLLGLWSCNFQEESGHYFCHFSFYVWLALFVLFFRWTLGWCSFLYLSLPLQGRRKRIVLNVLFSRHTEEWNWIQNKNV